MKGLLGALATYWENLTARERRLLGALGAVAGLIFAFLPVYLLSSSIAELEEENAEITAALRQISGSRPQLIAQRANQLAAEARYARRAPALGSFLEAKAGEQENLSLSDVQHEPERERGGFRIRHTRARIQQDAGLRSLILFLAAIENSRYPIAIERIHVDHPSAGDSYRAQVGVLAFDRPEPSDSERDGGTPTPAKRGGRPAAGPARP